MERRDFLASTGLAFGAAVALRAGLAKAGQPAAAAKGPSGAATTSSTTSATSPANWVEVRGLFALQPDLVHMAGFYLASHPLPVREAIERYRRALDENPIGVHHGHGGEHELRVLESVGRYLATDPANIALTDSTTMGLGLLYTGLLLKDGQEILSTTHDHMATRRSLDFRAKRNGTEVRRVTLYEKGTSASTDAIVSAIVGGLTPKTRIVAVTWVHSGTGVKLPIRAIADAIAEVNKGRAEGDRVILCVDGVHGIGVEDETMASLGCDFFCAGTHKWMFGPRGTGIVFGNPRAQEIYQPSIPAFAPVNFMARAPGEERKEPTWGMTMSPGGFHSFEHRWALSEAFDLHMRLGKARVAERIHALNTQAKEALASMKHVTLHTPMSPALSAGIVCFEVAGMTPEQVVAALAENRIVASVTPYAVKYARLAPSLLTSEADVEKSVKAVGALG